MLRLSVVDVSSRGLTDFTFGAESDSASEINSLSKINKDGVTRSKRTK